MIARTKSYVFTEKCLAAFPLRRPFWAAQLMFFIWFSKQKPNSLKQRFQWRILRVMFPVKTARKLRQPFVWIRLHYNFFVIRYHLLTEDCRKARNFKYQKLVFSFMSYVIILLFSHIYIYI